MSAMENQVGGSHYKGFVFQPIEFIVKNDLSFLAGCIIKRICRYDKDGGKGIQDLEKIKHEVDLIIELYPELKEEK
jgi:hypothetical protein